MAPVRRRTTALLVVAGLLLLVVVGLAWFLMGSDYPAGSGSGADTSGPPAPPPPAWPQVISDAEAAAALGAAVARTAVHDGFLVRTCTFWSSSDRYLLVQVARGDVLDGSARFQVGLFTGAGTPAAADPAPRLEAAARAIAARL